MAHSATSLTTNSSPACGRFSARQCLIHCPASHTQTCNLYDRHSPERKWCHEEGSEMMFDALIKQNPHIAPPQDHVNFIKDLIRGRPRLTTGEKPFLFQIVSNAENGLDVDKCTSVFFPGLFPKIDRCPICLNLIDLIILLGML